MKIMWWYYLRYGGKIWQERNDLWWEDENIWREGLVLSGKRIAIDLGGSGVERVFSKTINVGTSSLHIYGKCM